MRKWTREVVGRVLLVPIHPTSISPSDVLLITVTQSGRAISIIHISSGPVNGKLIH